MNDKLSAKHNTIIKPEINFLQGLGNNNTGNLETRLDIITSQIAPITGTLRPLLQFLVISVAPSKIYMLEHQLDPAGPRYIDLFLVISPRPGVSFKELELLLEIPYRESQEVTCSLHGEGNVVQGLRDGHIFYSLHFTPANLVYDNKTIEYPLTPPDVLQTIKQASLERFNRCYTKAIDFYEAAIFLWEKYASSIALFMLHQAAELVYRSILLCLHGCDKKTHEIRALKKYVIRCAHPLIDCFPGTNENDQHLVAILDAAYVCARYDDGYSIGNEDAVCLFEKVKTLLSSARSYMQERLRF